MACLFLPHVWDHGHSSSHGVRVNRIDQGVWLGSRNSHPMFAQRVALENPACFEGTFEKGCSLLDLWVTRRGGSSRAQGALRDVGSFNFCRPRREASVKARMQIAERHNEIVCKLGVGHNEKINVAVLRIEIPKGKRPIQIHPAEVTSEK